MVQYELDPLYCRMQTPPLPPHLTLKSEIINIELYEVFQSQFETNMQQGVHNKDAFNFLPTVYVQSRHVGGGGGLGNVVGSMLQHASLPNFHHQYIF